MDLCIHVSRLQGFMPTFSESFVRIKGLSWVASSQWLHLGFLNILDTLLSVEGWALPVDWSGDKPHLCLYVMLVKLCHHSKLGVFTCEMGMVTPTSQESLKWDNFTHTKLPIKEGRLLSCLWPVTSYTFVPQLRFCPTLPTSWPWPASF